MCDCQAEIVALRERIGRLEALLLTSLSTKESNLEREGSVAAREEDLPAEWESTATTDRRRKDLPDVDLHAEWYKYRRDREAKGKPISRGDWLLWAYRTRLDHTNQPRPKPEEPSGSHAASDAPKVGQCAEPWEQRCRSYGKGMRWNYNDGPAPGEPDCRAPAELAAAALAARAKTQGIAPHAPVIHNT